MGVYERWLVARGNVFLPSAATVAKLVERLRAEGWIVDPASADLGKLRFRGKREERAKATGGYAVKTVENTFGEDADAKIAASTEALPKAITAEWLADDAREEVRLVWPVDADDPPVKYPLSQRPDGAVRWALEVHRAPEYVYPVVPGIGALPTECRCSEDLSFEWDDEEVVAAFERSTGIFAECDECSRTFDPSKGSATIANPFDGSKDKVPGGGAYRFGLKVDCGEQYVAAAGLTFAPELVALVEKEFGRSFYEFGCVR
ncbi:MAG: hypothetical protein KF764_14280 [Labilithrix sp.]|nr:hypothetical protein [Labilithrix sp.]MBX3221331.1 hypothetical protein [Labilithrix sp.]